MGREVEQPYLPAQMQFVGDRRSRFVGYVGGYGTGKTEASVLKAFDLGIVNHPWPGMIIEPTFDQLLNVWLESARNILDRWRVPEHHRRLDRKQNNLFVRLNGKWVEIRLRSADREDKLAGHNLGHAIVDEGDFVKERVARQVKMRVGRSKRIPCPQLCVTGTPERQGGYFQRWFETAPLKGSRLIRSSTDDNHFLPPGYYDDNMSHLSEQEQRQYKDGYWVSFSGRVYTHWSAERHVTRRDLPEHGEWVMACDFGWGVSAWFLGHVDDRGQIHFFDEIIGEKTSTLEMTQVAAERWAQHFARMWDHAVTPEEAARRVVAIGDPNGGDGMRRSSSDAGFLKLAGFLWRARETHIEIRDRVNAVQRTLARGKVTFDPQGCAYAIKCLEQHDYDPKTGKPRKGHPTDGLRDLSHACDAVGYLIEWYHPTRLTGGNVLKYH